MSRSKIIIWILGFITVIITSYFYFRSNRFDISKEKGEYSYKIDQWTGETWVLAGDQAIKVESNDNSNGKNSDEEVDKSEAIKRVKNANTFHYSSDNKYQIKYKLEDLKGRLNVLGWEARKVDDQTYLVSYKYKLNDKLEGFYFEFNTKADLIRNVSNDYNLKVKYDLIKPDTTKRDERRTFSIDDIEN